VRSAAAGRRLASLAAGQAVNRQHRRSLSGVIRTVETLTTGVLLRSLREGIGYSAPTGRMLAGFFAALAEYERELMHKRGSR